MGYLGVVVLAVLVLAGAFVLWRNLRFKQQLADRQQAMEEFESRRSELAQQFLLAAAATGKPRGLRWKSVELTGSPVFAVDPASAVLYALNAATISFDAVEGGGMEDVEAVSNLRSATAVFIARNSQWTTEGRVIFNLDPTEALEKFRSSLAPISA